MVKQFAVLVSSYKFYSYSYSNITSKFYGGKKIP